MTPLKGAVRERERGASKTPHSDPNAVTLSSMPTREGSRSVIKLVRARTVIHERAQFLGARRALQDALAALGYAMHEVNAAFEGSD